MNPIKLTESDLRQHVIKIGFDVFPQIEIASERTRLNMFAEEAIQRFPTLFDGVVSGTQEFRVSRSLGGPEGKRGAKVDTLTITPRGPLFMFPVTISGPTGSPMFEAKDEYRKDFGECSDLFFSRLPNRQRMRVGLVRELLFTTGEEPCVGALTSLTEFAGAKLHGGEALLTFRDDNYNVRIRIVPIQLMRATSLPVGTTVREGLGHGLQVVIDVNNTQPQPLTDADIEEVLDRADSIWPRSLLEYLAGEAES